MRQKTDRFTWLKSMKNKNWNNDGRLKAIVLLCIAVAMWVLNYLTPKCWDDHYYPYMFVGDFFDINRPIESFKDILISQYNHYFGFINGRFFVHIIVQLFAGILGKPIFNICNAIAFALFVYLMTRLTCKVNIINILFVCAIIFLLYPEFDDTMLWMSGSINYLWTSIVICLFIMLFESLRTEELQTKHFLWLIPSVIAGWTNEGITFPLAISLVIYAIINYKTISHQAVLPLIIGFVIGALFCAFAPSTIGRAGLVQDNILMLLILRIYIGLTLCVKLKAIWVLLFTLFILYLIKRDEFKTWFKKLYIDNIIIWNAMIISFGVVFLSGNYYSRVGIGVELFAIVLWLRLMPELRCVAVTVIRSICCILWGGVFGLVVFYSIQNYQAILRMFTNDSGLLIVEQIHIPKYLEQYIVIISQEDLIAEYLSSNIKCKFLAASYNCEHIKLFPKVMYDDIINGSDRLYNIGKQSDYPFYIVPIDDDIKELKPRCILSPVDYSELPFYYRPIKYLPRIAKACLFSETEFTPRWYTLNIAGKDYIIVMKTGKSNDRLEAIVLN